MKNIIYISSINYDKKTGVSKKILQQIFAFRSLGYNVSFFIKKNGCCFLKKDDEELFVGRFSKNKIISNMQFIYFVIKTVKKSSDINIAYIRKIFSNPYFISLLKLLKRKGIGIIEELPTYPYDSECEKSPSKAIRFVIKIDKLYRKKEKKYIHHYVTYSDDEEIFGTPAISIVNGVNTDQVKPINWKLSENTLNILCVAMMEYWQGYDRLIRSLYEYNKTTNKSVDIKLHLVGDGSKLEEWKALTRNLNLESNVIFYGFLENEKLDDIFSLCQIGCAPLGASRKGLKSLSSLKVKEYIARGLPFIYSTPEKFIDDFKYAFKVNDDENLIQLNQIVDFYKKVGSFYSLEEMQDFSRRHYDWTIQMEKALSYFFKEGK